MGESKLSRKKDRYNTLLPYKRGNGKMFGCLSFILHLFTHRKKNFCCATFMTKQNLRISNNTWRFDPLKYVWYHISDKKQAVQAPKN